MSKQEIVDYVMDTPHNINPAILNQKLDEMEVQPDWNQNDPTAPDYVKNRPFYTEGKEAVLINGDFKSFSQASNDFIATNIEITFVEGESYTLYVNGESRGTVIYTDGDHVIFGSGYDSWQVLSNGGIAHFAGSGTYTIKFVQGVETVHKLDEKYLPNRVFIIDTTASDFGNKVSDPTYGDSVKEALLNGKIIFVYDGIAYGTVGSFVIFDASASGQGIGLNLYIITDKCLLLGSLEYVDIISLQISSI